jgi:integrase
MRAREGHRRASLTKRTVDAAKPQATRYELWDETLAGFGLRIAPSGTKTFILRYRPRGGGRRSPKRFMSIGRYGVLTPDEARSEARSILGKVAKEGDPALARIRSRGVPTVSALAALFVTEHVKAKRKPGTASGYETLLQKVILPGLGNRRADSVTRADVARLHLKMKASPYYANRALAVTCSMFSWASKNGHVAEGFNPTHGVERFKEHRRERFLSGNELQRLGEVLRLAETTGLPWDVDTRAKGAKFLVPPEKRFSKISPHVTGAIRLLLFTGCRLREILSLKWDAVDFERKILNLADSKTGKKSVMLGAPALKVLTTLPRLGDHVIAGGEAGKPRADLKRPWQALQRHAGLTGVRIHDLRHSFASMGAGAGFGLPVIGKLLGHSQAQTTARYAHLADHPVRAASEAISSRMAAALGDEPDSGKRVIRLVKTKRPGER